MAKKKVPDRPPIVAKILNNLSELKSLECRSMFGCVGLYSESVFFGIIFGDDLFFRTDEKTRQKYIKRDMIHLEFRDNQKSNNYYQVPDSVINSKTQLSEWAREAIEAQRRRHSTAQKTGRKSPPHKYEGDF